jgi:tetratricopeptide (TPR) repeat protein
MRTRTLISRALLPVILAGCALYSDVSIAPLIVTPTTIEHGADIHSALKRSDFLRAIEMTSNIETRQHRTSVDLAALGYAELAAGRYDSARRHLREAIDLDPYRTALANVEWGLSEVEYMSNNYDASLDWAKLSQSHGMSIKQWHLGYLEALANVDVYHFAGKTSDSLKMRVGRPDVPRIDVLINGSTTPANAVVDSGAVLSIISQELASKLPVRRLKVQPGTFFGLLGEPITVEFGILDKLELAGMIVENVPVAIMPDEKMTFFVNGERTFSIDFLLGANLLKEFRLEFDFPRSLLTFTKLTTLDRRPDPAQNVFMENFRPMVHGTVNRKGWYLFVLDTGSEVTFLNESQMPTLPIAIQPPRIHTARLQGLGGSQKHGGKVQNVQVGLDKWEGTFRDLPMYSSSNEQERAVGIVGENFLKNFRVVLDFGRMRMDLYKS